MSSCWASWTIACLRNPEPANGMAKRGMALPGPMPSPASFFCPMRGGLSLHNRLHGASCSHIHNGSPRQPAPRLPIRTTERIHPMGYKQTPTHRFGKASYHQIGLVRGQFGNVPFDKWLLFLQDTGFDGWEEASWELDLARCDNDTGAEEYAKERVELARKHGLEIFTVATHLQGQALGDEPSAKTLQFIGGEAVEAYKAWRSKGHNPPRTNPYFVPDEVGRLVHQQAQKDLIRVVRLS